MPLGRALTRVLPQFAVTLEIWLAMHADLRSSRPCRIVFDALAAGLRRYLAAAQPPSAVLPPSEAAG